MTVPSVVLGFPAAILGMHSRISTPQRASGKSALGPRGHRPISPLLDAVDDECCIRKDKLCHWAASPTFASTMETRSNAENWQGLNTRHVAL